MIAGMTTYETTQPWVIYRYGLTHDRWWPFWNSTRFLGRARIECECAVCGEREIVSFRIPRFGPVPIPESGRHVERERFLADHAHPDRGAPMSWAKPLLNMTAHQGGAVLVLRAVATDAKRLADEGFDVVGLTS